MGAIFLFSTDLFAAPRTGSLLEAWMRAWFPALPDVTVAAIHVAIRKAAHVAAYAVLAYFYAVGATGAWRPRLASLHQAGMILLATVGYAALDEWHQSFSALRTGTWKDVVWDAAGSVIALAGLGARISRASTRGTSYWRSRGP